MVYISYFNVVIKKIHYEQTTYKRKYLIGIKVPEG